MTVYAHVEDGTLIGVYDLIPETWKGISNFPALIVSDEDLRPYNLQKIIKQTYEFNSDIERLSDPTYTIEDGEVIEHREVIPSSFNLELHLADMRFKRDQAMRDFEWRYTRYFRQVRLGQPTTDNLEALDAYMDLLANLTDRELGGMTIPEFK